MTNKEIANQFDLLSKLLDIHGDNSYRSKTYSIAAFKINQLETELATLSAHQITDIEGIGDIIGKKIEEILQTGKLRALEKLIEETPPGILEMARIKGIGPKKVNVIWKTIGITSPADLLGACEDDLLLNYKGFGKKTQENIKSALEFYLSQQGSVLYAHAESLIHTLKQLLQQELDVPYLCDTGDFRRQMETISYLDFVVPLSLNSTVEKLKKQGHFSIVEYDDEKITCSYPESPAIRIYADEGAFAATLFHSSGPASFLEEFAANTPVISLDQIRTEEEIFTSAGMQNIPPFLRDLPGILTRAKRKDIPEVIQPNDIRGIIHCHSNWSDGINSIEQLANACIGEGLEYLVLSDHSKAAFYANGLTEERIQAQHELINKLNSQLQPFKIFKSIECDILSDGTLDYDNDVLAQMDLVIVSVHSNQQMNEEKATTRILKAIENPYTTILGHMTGRLLLRRPGYPVDYKTIIDACAANNVVIEVNANPRRLDMSWEWIPYALEKDVLLSVNPDAHSFHEFYNTKYGVLAAQKGMLTANSNLSSFTLPQFEEFLEKRRNKKPIS